MQERRLSSKRGKRRWLTGETDTRSSPSRSALEVRLEERTLKELGKVEDSEVSHEEVLVLKLPHAYLLKESYRGLPQKVRKLELQATEALTVVVD